MSTLYNMTMQEGVTFFFGHFYEHWPLANSSVINAALQLKRWPTPDLKRHNAFIMARWKPVLQLNFAFKPRLVQIIVGILSSR